MTPKKSRPAVAYFITDHGFGHAGRAAAVMEGLRRQMPGLRFELFTTCPKRFFSEALQSDFGYHKVRVDVGVVQWGPLSADIQATAGLLDGYLPFSEQRIGDLANRVIDRQCRVVICDISAMGIVVARRARLPSVLIENFTWDWMYTHHLDQAPSLAGHIPYLQQIYAQADLRIQSEPFCQAVEGAERVPPISRSPRTKPQVVRKRLNIPTGAKLVLVSMGGIPDRFQFLAHLPSELPPYLVIPGAEKTFRPHTKVIALSRHSPFFHPDLVNAADLIIGKAGYSTVAEVYRCGVPFGYIARTESPESVSLTRFIGDHMSARPIRIDDYEQGRWFDMLPELLALPRIRPLMPNGAETVARLLQRLVA